MNEIDPNKYISIINKKSKKTEENKVTRYIKNLCFRVLVVFVIVLSVLIACKKEDTLKEKLYNYVYKENLSFTKINKLYNKYLGGIFPLKNINNTAQVFNENISYSSSSIFHDGVKLTVNDNYLVPSLSEGMVVFIGKKENYGNVIIIENLDGINFWYGNIESTSLKLYDYIEKGSLIGEVNKELYLVFSKEDKFLNYEDYLS